MDAGEHSHEDRVEAVREMIVAARREAAQAALELSEDGAQPHLVAALAAAEAGLRREALQLARSTAESATDTQQSFAV